jgi:hypothetical protein
MDEMDEMDEMDGGGGRLTLLAGLTLLTAVKP